MRTLLGVVRLNMCGISVLGLVGLNEYCPGFFPSTSIFSIQNLSPTSLPIVLVLPSSAFPFVIVAYTLFIHRYTYVPYYTVHREILSEPN